MVILFAQYALFMCLAIISNKSSCDQKLIEASSGSGVYWKAACAAKCMGFEKYKTFENCIDYCQLEDSPNDEEVLRKINENHDLLLLCRDDRSITLKIVLPPNGYTGRQKRSDAIQKSNKMQLTNITHIQEIYVINVSLANEPKHISVYMSNENLITIGNLSQHTTYNVSVAVVYSSDEYSIIAKGRQFMTLRRGYKPKEIQEISLVGFASDETNEMRLTAFISWKPSYDMTCWYDIVCFSPERVDMELTPIEIRDPHGLFTYSLDNLTFSTVYHVGIRAMNTNDTSKESAMKWEIITTPPCIEWHNNNFNICAPLKPEGLSIKEHFLLHNEFSLNVSWQHPLHEPDYYTLKILDLDQLHTFNVKKYEYNVAKEQSWYFIPNLTLSGMLFEVHLTAYTPGGSSTAFVTQPTNKPHQVSVFPDRNYILKFGIAILAPIFGIAILSLTIFVVCHRRAKLKRFKERCKYFQELEKKAPIDPKSTFDFPTKTLTVPPAPDDILKYQLDLEEKLFFNDDMEINRSNVELYEVLGEGAFGLVRRGIFHDSNKDGDNNIREVAAKMLKDQPSVDDIRAFRREIEVMKSVGRHPNIVGIIGHCTRKYNEMLLLTEYCSFGNLLNFLRSEWKYLHELSFRKDSDHSKSLYKRSSMATTTTKEKTVQKPTENLNNFDSRIVDKIKLRYKHLNPSYDTSTSAYFRSLRSSTSSTLPSTSPPPPPSPPQAISFHSKSNVSQFNKSYGYEEICTNACKCRVDILTDDTNPLGENNKKNNPKGAQIKISRKCECRHKRSSLPSIENKGYYKNFFCFSSLKDGGKEQQQRPAANKNTKDSIEAGREPLSGADLLEIAKQVAMGMEFLSKNKVVHRDLAARNVLVSSDRTVKIADFGLSRDVYQENVYKKTGNGKLPIKWLAIESMTHQVYTSQSDVWSFGILLYEITTLGGTPYPSIPTNRLLHLLKTGYRMEKPKNCGQGFYNLMTSCWCFNPAERPNFTEIIKILDSLLSESPQLPIDELNSPKTADSPDTPTSSESYLKPL